MRRRARYRCDLDDERGEHFAIVPVSAGDRGLASILLFTLPAGALADMVDRKRMMFIMTVWLAIAAGGLALTGWFHLISPWILMIAVFLIGTGFAVYSPAWASIQPEIVSNDELPSAATLGGLQLNISGIIGPAIGGVLLHFVSANAVFAMNSLAFCCSFSQSIG